MDRDEIRDVMTELIADVMPEIEDVAFNKNIVAEYGVNSFSDYELALDGYRTFEDMVVLIQEKLEDKE